MKMGLTAYAVMYCLNVTGIQPKKNLPQQHCFNFPNRPCQAPSLLRDTIRDKNK